MVTIYLAAIMTMLPARRLSPLSENSNR